MYVVRGIYVDGQLERAREWQFNGYKKSRCRLKRAHECKHCVALYNDIAFSFIRL